jgi:hypothetical protein
MADEQSFPAGGAEQLLDFAGEFRPGFEEFVDLPGSVLVVDDLHMATPRDDPWVVADLTSSVIDRLTDNQFAVVLPRVSGDTEAVLLTEAGVLLSAEPFSDELLMPPRRPRTVCASTCAPAPATAEQELADERGRRCPRWVTSRCSGRPAGSSAHSRG